MKENSKPSVSKIHTSPSPSIASVTDVPLPIHRQNNSRLSELSSKISTLRGVTIDIYDNARSQDVIDNSVCLAHSSPIPALEIPSFYTSLCASQNSKKLTITRSPKVGSLLFNDHHPKRQRGPLDTHGAVREQSCCVETGWDNHRGGGVAVVDIELFLVKER